jgi:molybdate transport system ATP-binding protein
MSLYVDIEKQLGDFALRTKFETEGGVLGLLGASGCGKSYTLKCIAGIERPDRGRIVLDGVPLFDSEKRIDLPPQKRQVGYLFQNYALFPNMTVRQNILCGLHAEPDKAKREKALAEAVELLQLQGLEQLRPVQLSGGQQQRAALARILVNRPRLLMLDEPFSALDTHLRGKLQIQMKQLLAEFGRDVLFVTHSRNEAYHMCGRIAVMDAGRVVTLRETKALFADPGSVAAALLTGCKNVAPARKAGEYLVEVPSWGVRLQTAQPVREGLRAVGVRAHYFSPKAVANRFAVQYVGEMEEPFEWIVQFRFADQPEGQAPLWWRVPKDRRPQTFPAELGLAPVNVLLLYE